MTAISRRSALALAAGIPLSMLAHNHAAAAPAMRYTMTAFTNANETDLYVYESTDALNFTPLAEPAYRPPNGSLLRDPSIFRHSDGVYYLTHTTAWEGHTIGFARSTDRVNWNHMYDLPVLVPGVTNTWAPEWFVDAGGQVNVIVSLAVEGRFTPHMMTATTPGLWTWSPLTPIAGLGARDGAAFGYIDTTIIPRDNRYFAFTKNEETKFIELAVAGSPLGPYAFVEQGNWANWGAPREGQCVIALPDGSWRIYFDAYNPDTLGAGKYYFSDSNDGFHTWTEPQELPGLSGTIRHCTVYPELLPG
ncbi:glycoside hydrolase family 43 protein [Nocardia altamirensis]|uniref:glycoside hydrolase family 43 protein n=1 Tax=Nocardia altamirensis TaxID=472158 RepID=UPI001FDFD818|nr:glycoside hydrolase family 43 protein [Nocardia altamirensis]